MSVIMTSMVWKGKKKSCQEVWTYPIAEAAELKEDVVLVRLVVRPGRISGSFFHDCIVGGCWFCFHKG